jgi:hypothetical protein
MPVTWVFALVLFAIAVIAAIAGVVVREPKVFAAAVVCALLGVVFTLVCSYDRVDTRNVGIITAFGNPVYTHGAGIVWHAPWQKLSELPESIQLQAFESNSYDDAAKGTGSNNNPAAINVRLGNNTNAYVDINLNWRIKEGAAGKMFQDYGGTGGGDVFDKIKQQLVDRQAQVMASKVFSTFNPQTVQKVVTPSVPVPGQPFGQQPPPPPVQTAPAQGADLPGMANEVKADLQGAVGQEIEILDVRIPRVWYDSGTQGRIDDYNKKVQETMNAAQDAQTANQRKLANDTISSSVQNPMTVVAQCINDQLKAEKDPGGCWGPMGGVGGAGGDNLSVIVPKPGS